MEIVLLLIGFAAGTVLVPPTISGGIQRVIRRKTGELIRGKKKDERKRR